ncbi:beta-defensin 132 [Marmota marmota marmota]|uniref:Beta-defensin n=1 Tax=Marmota marmota marmota TaxID=9994 RepID=A0A8C6AEF6_MARMA|nr:beta-defensin 132 [Marmota marmota marmota]
MKLPLLVLAALGFLAQMAPAHGGRTRCGRALPGHCRLHCHKKEQTMFMCDRYKQCCVLSNFLPEPVLSPYGSLPKSSNIKNTIKHKNQQPAMTLPQ